MPLRFGILQWEDEANARLEGAFEDVVQAREIENTEAQIQRFREKWCWEMDRWIGPARDSLVIQNQYPLSLRLDFDNYQRTLEEEGITVAKQVLVFAEEVGWFLLVGIMK